MRKLFLLSFFSVLLSSIQGQDLNIGGNYYFKTDLFSRTSDIMSILNQDDLPKDIEIREGDIVKIVDLDEQDDTVFFRYLLFSDSTNKNTFNINSEGSTLIFLMNKTEFQNLTNICFDHFRGFEVGTYTVPIRLRNSSNIFEFDSDASLGGNLVFKFGLNKRLEYPNFDFSVGTGITKVTLTGNNSLLGVEGTDFEDIITQSPAAFTITSGIVFNFTENINLGLYGGIDYVSSADNAAKWIHNRKPWFGIGVNVAFSKGENNNTGNPPQD